MATSTVDPDDGGADYASLSAWEAQNRDLVTANDTETAVCTAQSGSVDSAASVVLAGWTSSDAFDINITGDRTDGAWDATKYRLELANTTYGIFDIAEDFVTIDSIQMDNTAGSPTGDSAAIISNVGVDYTRIQVSNSILVGGRVTLRLADSDCTNGYYFKNVIYGGTAAAAFVSHDNGTQNFYGSTFASPANGLFRDAPATVVAKNCYAYGNSGSAYVGTITLTTCASEDATGTAGLQNIAYSTSAGAYFTNVTGGSEDHHISGSSDLKDAGTDTSGDSAPLDFSDDIEGTAQSGTWDIGAIVAPAAAGAPSRGLIMIISNLKKALMMYPVAAIVVNNPVERRDVIKGKWL